MDNVKNLESFLASCRKGEAGLTTLMDILRDERIDEITKAIAYERSYTRNSKAASVMPLTRLQDRLNKLREK